MSRRSQSWFLWSIAGAVGLLTVTLACAPVPPAGSLADPAEPEEARPISNRALRTAVAAHFPTALAGGLGSRPLVWFLADQDDRVLRSASGWEGLPRDSVGQELIDWASAVEKLPGMPATAQPGDLLQRTTVVGRADTVTVVWVRLQGGLASR
jgi:hypothetical protein